MAECEWLHRLKLDSNARNFDSSLRGNLGNQTGPEYFEGYSRNIVITHDTIPITGYGG
jgi:hypothetical protein